MIAFRAPGLKLPHQGLSVVTITASENTSEGALKSGAEESGHLSKEGGEQRNSG